MHERNCFITLTYADEHLPSNGELRVSDWQKFAKRVRKSHGRFRFFHCGEYGDENLRPHYHACMFGVDFAGDAVPFKKGLWLSQRLSDLWGHGFTTVGSLTYESAAYVARYCLKKATGDLAEVKYARVDTETGEVFTVRPEYVTMSRRPGIGSTWFDKFKSDVFPSDEVVHNGRRHRPPRFYDTRIPEFELAPLKAKRLEAALMRSEDLTPERLVVREQVAAARESFLSRDL